MKPTLVILAAGMGSRYGGLKQIDAIGPRGEAIMDYSIYDALQAGFKKIVFIIREEFFGDFKRIIGAKYQSSVEISYVFQSLQSNTPKIYINKNRKKPWGTAHAVLAAREEIDNPFLVINADDYYGPAAYLNILNYICDPGHIISPDYAMIGYELGNTISDFGHVARGVCTYDKKYNLLAITERTRIQKEDKKIVYYKSNGETVTLGKNELISMNFWGLNPTIFSSLAKQFEEFLSNLKENPAAEFFIPTVINSLLQTRRARVKIIPSKEKWFGITYKNDKKNAVKQIEALVNRGKYPPQLF